MVNFLLPTIDFTASAFCCSTRPLDALQFSPVETGEKEREKGERKRREFSITGRRICSIRNWRPPHFGHPYVVPLGLSEETVHNWEIGSCKQLSKFDCTVPCIISARTHTWGVSVAGWGKDVEKYARRKKSNGRGRRNDDDDDDRFSPPFFLHRLISPFKREWRKRRRGMEAALTR